MDKVDLEGECRKAKLQIRRLNSHVHTTSEAKKEGAETPVASQPLFKRQSVELGAQNRGENEVKIVAIAL